MRNVFFIFWNALLTAVVVTLLAGLFIVALPPVHQAVATVQGNDSDRLLIRSERLLREVMATSAVDFGQLPGWFEQVTGTSKDRYSLLSQSVSVADGEQTGQFAVSVEAGDAATALKLLDEVVAVYIRMTSHEPMSPHEKATLIARVEQIDEAIRQHLDRHPQLIDFEAGVWRLQREADRLSTQHEALLREQARLQQDQQNLATGSLDALAHPALIRELNLVAQQELTLADLAARYGPSHQKMIRQVQELAQARVRQQTQVELLGARLDQQLIRQRQKLVDIAAQRSEIDAEIATLRSLKIELDGLSATKVTRLSALQGLSQSEATRFASAAVLSDNLIGKAQLWLTGFVFLLAFFLVLALQIYLHRSPQKVSA